MTQIADPFGVLRRVMQPRERPRPGEVCEMCGEVVGGSHSHVASLSERRILCTCRACYLLFTAQGAGARRLRAVPERVSRAEDFSFRQAQWDDLAIPVDLVFLFQQSDLDDPDAPRRVVACYPSPAGATESELDLAAWAEIAAANPTLADVEPDVEAVLVRRHGDGEFTCLVVPIDACYELVGLVRQYWSGFQGGDEVWQHIDEFFAQLLARAGGPKGR
ncbi:MAG: hypothetical protein QOG80_3373 [Pseudonocardiales bacterium]|nr:hypothetical protein [Pseudonocardiales bacterium]